MKGCGDRGDYKTYCWGIINLNCSQKIYYYWLCSRFSFLRAPLFFFFFFSRVVILTILSQAKHGNHAESRYRRQFVRVKNKERMIYFYKQANFSPSGIIIHGFCVY